MPDTPADPPRDCAICPRLRSYLDALAAKEPNWHNAPVASFGDSDARLLVVGLAPGVKGANRTGRPFTGDYAGDLLYATLDKFGLSRGTFGGSPDDGLTLVDTMITNAVRCVPPANKPIGEEIRNCRVFLASTIESLTNLRVAIALGRVAHESVIAALGKRQKDFAFKHAACHALDNFILVDSFHCSRYNTNTKRLTTEMFEHVFEIATAHLNRSRY